MSSATDKLHPQYIKDSRGRTSFVVLPTGEYKELLEDLADLAAIAERRDEGNIDLDELKARLRKDGLLQD